MSFASPILLAFLGLAVPIILLYLLKQRRRRVEVSTLMFWDQILRDEQSVTSITKLKKLLSLLLQLIFLTLLALALARPLLSGKLTGARRVVLFIDASASMLVQEGERTRFDFARDRARGVVRGLSMGDTCMAIAVAAEPDLIHPFADSKKDLLEAIGKLTPSHGETNFKKALQLVEQLPPDERETHVYLVTDGAFDPVEISPLAKTRFAYLPVGSRADNVGISAFSVRPLPSSPRDFQVHLELTNDSEEERSVPVELRVNGRLADAFEFTLPGGQSLTRTLRQFSAEGGEIEVIADVKDAFPLDNHAYATLPRPNPIKVRLVTPESIFLERALATDDDVLLETVKPEAAPSPSDAVVTIYSGCKPAATPPGNSIFIGDWPDDLGLKKRSEVAKPLFTEWQRDHPVNRHLALQNVGIEKCAGVEPGLGWQKLAANFSDPLVLLREEADRKVLVVTFDPQGSDLPLRVAFPILIANTVRYMAGADTSERWVNPVIGSILVERDVARFADGARSETNKTNLTLKAVIAPGGARISLDGEQALVPVAQAGFYRGEWESGGTNALFAANLSNARESRITPSERLPFISKQPIQEIKQGFRLGFEPWIVLTALAVILSVAEWLMFHRRVIE